MSLADAGSQRLAVEELGRLAQQIRMGKAARVTVGPWWKSDIFDQLKALAQP
jgi:hypothetical protein